MTHDDISNLIYSNLNTTKCEWELCVDLQLHVGSQSLHCVQVNSGLTNQKQPPLFTHLPFDPQRVWEHSLRTHIIIITIIIIVTIILR